MEKLTIGTPESLMEHEVIVTEASKDLETREVIELLISFGFKYNIPRRTVLTRVN